MAAQPKAAPIHSDPANRCLEHAPTPMAMVEGATHVVRDVNPTFCRLIGKTQDELVGKPLREMWPEQDECLSLLDRVYRTGQSESLTKQEAADPRLVFRSYTMWPVMAHERTVGVMMQVNETPPLHEKALAISEALMLGALRQHERAAAANSSNIQLQTEIREREQRERDALMLANEISHRIKNNLQIVFTLIGYEARSAPAACVRGYETMQTRIGAIAELYDLISQSGSGPTVAADAYLREIAKAMAASLIGDTSGIKIEVKAQALEIDPDRAVPFGLLVNELVTNAIKHAFPGGTGQVILSLEQIGGESELTVADNGVGMKDKDSAKAPEKHGTDYVAIFVRQLGGTVTVSGSEGTGTVVRVRLPLLVAA
jgi:PAS domain S-box-containing protein